ARPPAAPGPRRPPPPGAARPPRRPAAAPPRRPHGRRVRYVIGSEPGQVNGMRWRGGAAL
ncbi:tryptophan biosynthesis modulator TrpM, partial [Streptomyces lavendulae]|uniref:tryptophan biosynthesis modulator TrpM n=1 Tax=Streptomyces lavendulae TaxID=1914 RepID=UPI00368ACE32